MEFFITMNESTIIWNNEDEIETISSVIGHSQVVEITE